MLPPCCMSTTTNLVGNMKISHVTTLFHVSNNQLDWKHEDKSCYHPVSCQPQPTWLKTWRQVMLPPCFMSTTTNLIENMKISHVTTLFHVNNNQLGWKHEDKSCYHPVSCQPQPTWLKTWRQVMLPPCFMSTTTNLIENMKTSHVTTLLHVSNNQLDWKHEDKSCYHPVACQQQPTWLETWR